MKEKDAKKDGNLDLVDIRREKIDSVLDFISMDIEAEAILPEIEEERCRFKDTDRWSKTAAHACTTPSSIEKVIKNLKKFTGRGPQQITPEVDKAASGRKYKWLMRSSHNHLLNIMINSDCGNADGGAFKMMRLVALWKSKEKT